MAIDGSLGQVTEGVAATIVVVGSLNTDLVVEVPRLPRPGETVLGRRHFRNAGGKGANQAVAAAADDAFSGAPAQALTAGSELLEAVRWACAAGALTATRSGAQAALPSADEVRDVLK